MPVDYEGDPNICLVHVTECRFLFCTTSATIDLKFAILNTVLPIVRGLPAKIIVVRNHTGRPILMVGLANSPSPIFTLGVGIRSWQIEYDPMTLSFSSEYQVELPFNADASRSLCGIQLPNYICMKVTLRNPCEYEDLRYYLAPSGPQDNPREGDVIRGLSEAFTEFAQFDGGHMCDSYFDSLRFVYFTTICLVYAILRAF